MLWEAVTAASMEDMLRATVLEHRDASAEDTQLVVVAMSRALGPFPSVDALVAWCGGLPLLYEEIQLRFPHAAAIGVSARLAALRPFPFASGSAVTTVCVVTAVASAPSALVFESVALGVRNATNVLVRALSQDGSPCPILCLEGATREQFPNMVHDVLLSSLPPLRSIAPSAFNKCMSLRSACLSDLPLLESIGEKAFAECLNLSSVDLSNLPALRCIREGAFSLQSSILSNVDLSNLPSLRTIGKSTFWKCESLRSVSLANLPLLESIGEGAFGGCVRLSSVDFSSLSSLQRIGTAAFWRCTSLQSISIVSLPLLESIGDGAFYECVNLSSVGFSSLLSLRTIGASAFFGCHSLHSINFAYMPLLVSIGYGAFAGCDALFNVGLSRLSPLRVIPHICFSSLCVTMKEIE